VTKAFFNRIFICRGISGRADSHLMDVLTDANDILEELGVHFEHSASEATAAATWQLLSTIAARRLRSNPLSENVASDRWPISRRCVTGAP